MQKVNIFKPDMSVITHTGIFEDVTEDGMAVLLREDGEKEVVFGGKMRPTFSEWWFRVDVSSVWGDVGIEGKVCLNVVENWSFLVIEQDIKK